MKLILLMALTLDGKIAKDAAHFPDWTATEDKRLFARLSRQAGVVIMGSKTFDTLGKPLPKRHHIVLTRSQERKSVWDNLEFTAAAPAVILQNLERSGFSEAILAGGSAINTLFARQGLIDEVIVTISPLIFGRGLSLFDDDVDLRLELVEMEQVGNQLVMLRYRVLGKAC